MRAQLRLGAAGAAELRAALTAAEEAYVNALAARDRVYAEEIGIFRAAIQDIAATAGGAAALARFNAGDEVSALAILDDLRTARDRARKTRSDIESAAEGRGIAKLALEAQAKGKLPVLQVIARYEDVTRLDPGVFLDWVMLSQLYREAGRLADAKRAVEAASHKAASDPERSVAFQALADVQQKLGDRSGALASYRASLAIVDRLARVYPDNLELQRALLIDHGRIRDLLIGQGEQAIALPSHQASLAIAERLVKADPSNAEWHRVLSDVHGNVGDVLAWQGQWADALASHQASLAIREQLAKADPANTGLQHDMSIAQNSIGKVLSEQGQWAAALASYQASLARGEALAKIDPDNVQWQRDLLISHNSIGDVLVFQGGERWRNVADYQASLAAALPSYHAALAVAERLVKTDPGNLESQRDLAATHVRIGNVLIEQGDARALRSYQESQTILERLAKADRANSELQRDLSISQAAIGDVLLKQGDRPGALAHYQAALAIRERRAEADPVDALRQRDLVTILVNLNDVTLDKAYAVRALDIVLALQRRGALAPRDAWLLENLKRRIGQ